MNGAAPALVVLAAAVLCLPGPPARLRLRRLAPAHASRFEVGLPRRLPIVAAGAALGAVAAGVAGGLVGALAAALWWGRRERARAERTADRTAAELADALARIVEELRTGAHPAAALEGVRGDGPAVESLLAPVAAATRLGESAPAALRRVADRCRSGSAGPGPPDDRRLRGPKPAASTRAGAALGRDLQRIAAAWALAERHGAPLADLLSGVLTDLRWRLAFRRRLQARLAGPRATAGVLTVLPLLGLALGHLLGADPLAVLRHGFAGQALLLVGAVLVAAGLGWSDRILSGAMPR